MSAPEPPSVESPPGILHHPVQGTAPISRRRIILIIVGVMLILAAIFGFFLYRYQWRGGLAAVITKVLPFPAAIVDGRVIRYSDFQDDLTVLERFYQAEGGGAAAGSVFPSEEEMKSRVLDQMIKDKLAEELAARYDIVVTSDEVAKAYDATILDQAALGTTTGKARASARAADTLQQMYGLRPSQFKNNVFQPFLIRQKLERAIQSDETLNAEKRKKAEAALAELKAGKAFRDIALTYSEDPNVKATGGDRGSIGRGLLPPEVEAAAFALKTGETSGVVKSVFGYHVLRVTDRTEVGGQVIKVHLYEILVHPIQLDDYLEEQKKTATIITFVH
jgi:parvulin-like peptidyl-prolyl isomerase